MHTLEKCHTNPACTNIGMASCTSMLQTALAYPVCFHSEGAFAKHTFGKRCTTVPKNYFTDLFRNGASIQKVLFGSNAKTASIVFTLAAFTPFTAFTLSLAIMATLATFDSLH